MKRLIALLTLTLVIFNVFGAKQKELILTKGNSPYTIIYSSTATQAEKTAVQELVKYMKAVSGTGLTVKKENDKLNEPAIYVGQTAFAKSHGIQFKDFGKEEWLIKVIGKNIVIGGGRPRGTIYGVWKFLDRQTGIMWLDERFTFIPDIPQIKCPANLDLRGKPVFEVRGIFAYHRKPAYPRQLFMARNRQNLFHGEPHRKPLRELGIYPIIGSPKECHTYYSYTKNWKAKDINCFSLSKKGKRLRAVNAKGPGQVCFSNPKTIKLFSAKLRDFIKLDRKKCKNGNYPTIYDVSANDNKDKCVCPKCLAAAKKYGSYGGLVLEFTNAIADSIAKDYPDVRVQMFAYMFAQPVPKNIKARSNVLVRLAQMGTEFGWHRDTLRPLSHRNNKLCRQQVIGWSKVASLAIWDYWIMFHKDPEASSAIPAMIKNMRFYHNQHVISIFAEVEKPLNTCFYALRIWLGLRLMNNPDLDAAKQIDRFLKAYYGPAAPFMKKFLNYLEARNSEIKGYLGNIVVQQRTDLDDRFFAKVDKLLDSAEKAATGKPDYLRHIAKERTVIDYVHLLRRSKLKAFDQKPVTERLKKSFRTACEDYLKGKETKKAMDKLHGLLMSLTMQFPPPKEFRNSNIVIDITWPRLQETSRKSLLTDVADATGGKAIVLKNVKDTGELKFGFYDLSNKKFARDITIKRKLLPQDEKFHFYKIGKVKLSPRSYIWAHPTWYIQRRLDEFYKKNGNNNYKIFISLKVEGPAYVNGSKKENSVMLDRILLIR